MCGICGIAILAGSKKIVKNETLKRMTDVLIYRGPDCDGYYISSDYKTGLGFGA